MAKGDWKVIHCTVDEAETKLAEVPGGFTLVITLLIHEPGAAPFTTIP